MRSTRSKLHRNYLAGAGCQKKQNLPAKGKVFLLDIPFYRTRQRMGPPGFMFAAKGAPPPGHPSEARSQVVISPAPGGFEIISSPVPEHFPSAFLRSRSRH